MSITRVADKLIAYLVEIGVRDMFVVSGGGAIFFDDAILKNESVTYYCCHHEQAVAMASEAYARVTNSLGVSVVTTGPGGTNAITGVAGSWIDSIPHLVLSGQVFLKQTIAKSGLRQLGVQEINIIDLVRPITKYAVMVERPEDALFHLQKAVHLAVTGRPGPVWVDVPADICNAALPDEEFLEYSPDLNPGGTVPVPGAEMQLSARRVADLLRQSRRPLMHMGQGVKISGALEQFFSVAESFGIPFVTARNANQLVEWTHPLYVGRPGTFAQRGANFAVQNADVYIAIGTRLTYMQTGYNVADFARNARKVMVDIDRSELEKEGLDLEVKVHGDAKAFLTALLEELNETSLDTAAWAGQCSKWKSMYPVVLPEHRKSDLPVNSYHFVDVLSDVLESGDIVVTDMGLAFQSTHQAFRVKKGQKLFTNSGFAAMGWGLPAAIGACIANNKQRVICIAGDGGMQMNIQELATIMHNKLPIKVFIYNNGGYLTIKQTQEVGFGGRLMGCNSETGLGFPDFLKVAAAHDIRAERIENQRDLRARVQELVEFSGPIVCELMMDPDQPQSPKIINRRDADGRTTPSSFEDMHPYLSDQEIADNMIAERDSEEQ